jgi:hypothetical protein
MALGAPTTQGLLGPSGFAGFGVLWCLGTLHLPGSAPTGPVGMCCRFLVLCVSECPIAHHSIRTAPGTRPAIWTVMVSLLWGCEAKGQERFPRTDQTQADQSGS